MIERLVGRRVVASISGGKDSAALSLWLTEQEIEHDRVFMDTGWEHPKTYEYLRGPLAAKIGPITEIRNARGWSLVDLCLDRKGFPYGGARFCTVELKIDAMIAYIAARADAGEDLVNAVGIRRAESEGRSDAQEWEWSEGFDCETWRPLVDWTMADVVSIHARHGLAPNPLYLMGFSRVGCFPCIHANKGEIRLLAEVAPERIDLIRDLEKRIGIVSNADPKPSFFSLRGADGKKHRTPIDEVVAWSRTSRGGTQFDMFAQDPADAGCMRWGLCDTEGSEK